MAGGIIIAVILVVLIPVGFLLSGSVGAGLFGWLLRDNAESTGDPVWRELND